VLRDKDLSLFDPEPETLMEYSMLGYGFAPACQYWQGGEWDSSLPRTGLVEDSTSGGQYWSTGQAWMGVLPSNMQGLEPTIPTILTKNILLGYQTREPPPRGTPFSEVFLIKVGGC
jgi:hypothetical protein